MVEQEQMMLQKEDASKVGVDDDLRPFSEIRNKIEDVIDQVVHKNFYGKNYEAKTIQHLVNLASEEIIKSCQE